MLKFLNNYWLIGYLFVPILIFNLTITGEQQFVYLAYSFINGSFSLIHLPPTIADLSLYQGKYFWPLGPFPALLILPFVLIFKMGFLQGFVQFPLTILNFYLIYKISIKLNLSPNKSLLLAIFYIFGSIYTPIAIIPWSWFFAQVTATFFLLLAIYEFLESKRWPIIGLAIALATLTKANLILAAIFFLPKIFQKPQAFKNLIVFLIPVFMAIAIIGVYNYQRFNSILESGYSYQIIPEGSKARRDYGIISPKHIPANLYYMFIKTPDPVLADDSHVLKFPYLKFDPYGMSIFFMSPILFLLYKSKLNDPLVKSSLIATFAIILSITAYYGIGYIQVGYRYALDFFPFLLIILISAVKQSKLNTIKLLTIAGIVISWFFTLEKLAGF